MKALALTLALLLLAVPVFAADGDYDLVIVKPDSVKACFDTIKMHRFTRTAIVTFRPGNQTCTGDFGNEFDVTFMDRDDDLTTPENEESTEFIDFYNYIHTRIRAGDSFKKAVVKACKIKLGL